MEGAQSLSISLSLHLNFFFASNPLNTKNPQFFRIKVSTQTPSIEKFSKKTSLEPHKKPSQKVRKFHENDAFPSSLPLHTRNPRAIYKDIQRLSMQNKLKEALTIMDYVDQQGIPVNATTFSSLIAACIRAKSLTEAKQIHTHIRINGLENNEFLRTKLVHLYTSCGSLEDAQKVFDECSSTCVYPWNALIRGTVIAGGRRYRDVLSTYSEMREQGVELNVYTFSSVIKSFAGAHALRQGLKTHALLVKNGFMDSCILRTSLIDMYFKCGRIKLGCRMFEEIGERDIVVWGAMIAGFAHNRRQNEALDYMRMMIDEGIYPNSVIVTTILPVIGEVSARKLGQEVHAFALKKKRYLEQLPVNSGLIDMYCKCGDMGSGRRVFYGSMGRNAVSWTTLMSGYVSNGRLEQALRSIVWMQQERFRPDVVTVATVVPVCGELRTLKQGKEIHAYAMRNWFLPNISISTSLIKMYSKCGLLGYSCRLFDGMEHRNVISWTAIIDSYVENGHSNEAIDVFRSMQLSKHRPDSVTMARMLSICSEVKALKLGKEIHGHLLKKRFEAIPFVSAEVVKMYGSCGLIDKAMLAFNEIPVKGSLTWTAIIEAYGYNDMFQEAIDLFDQLTSDGFIPNQFTFSVVLSICDQAGFSEEACRIFNLMSRRYNIKATEEHYSKIIGLLTRLSRIDEAQRFIQMSSASP
ncbi:pentatricopeptide repeat-containing family protein [Tripterygium wilfordii]|uniref:Pentatricopeptide repeat-containing family protein n=1 Tax=Tripterygium wilfordii TaxID=458696 RepID=A0A7J7D6I1_TRIWF|nr:pentatricopeptide repeat-containing protein At1g71460, chloroplastic [Tripterygium wilfordii]KAF5741932.1 pentatricopeptide repeat-containing family protein [Tripterygium wilfordii]